MILTLAVMCTVLALFTWLGSDDKADLFLVVMFLFFAGIFAAADRAFDAADRSLPEKAPTCAEGK